VACQRILELLDEVNQERDWKLAAEQRLVALEVKAHQDAMTAEQIREEREESRQTKERLCMEHSTARIERDVVCQEHDTA
jgi:hypothetical protein